MHSCTLVVVLASGVLKKFGCCLPAGEGIEPTMLRYSYYTAGSVVLF
jgi:hypothetical protein